MSAARFALALSYALGQLLLAPPLRAAEPSPLSPYTYPHAGWAATPGGRGGALVRVTSLATDGPGSLRAALDTPGPRQIVFEVGGVIDMQGRSWRLREPFVSVAGQTAPYPGITLIRGELQIATHDVIVQHLSFRPGEYGRPKKSGGDHDGISTEGGAARVIVDHCSFSWATDENLSAAGPRFNGATPEAWRQATSHDLTFSNNLIYEGLANSVHTKGEHSKGSLVHDNVTGLLVYGNVYASNMERNALFKGGVHAAMVNNLIYNPGKRAVHYNLVAHEWLNQPYQTGKVTLVSNVYRAGPDTTPGLPLFTLGGAGDVELHLDGNLTADAQGQALPLVGRYTASDARIVESRTPYLPPGVTWVAASRLERELPLTAGAHPWARDPIDFKLLSDVAESRGAIIDSETDNQYGLPKYPPTRRAFDPAEWNLDDISPRVGWAAWASTQRPPKLP